MFLNKHPQPGEQNNYQGLARTGLDGDDFASIALLRVIAGEAIS